MPEPRVSKTAGEEQEVKPSSKFRPAPAISTVQDERREPTSPTTGNVPPQTSRPVWTLDHEGEKLDLEAQSFSLSSQPFSLRLGASGKNHLLNYALDGPEIFITLSTLQRMVMHDLQEHLVRLVGKIHATKNASTRRMEKAARLMGEYGNAVVFVTAVRDYDYMVEKNNEAKDLGTDDPFLITSRRRLSHHLFKDVGLLSGHYEGDEKRIYDRAARKWNNILPSGSRREIAETSDQARFFGRFWMGLAGGVAVIVPMMIMVLRPDLLTRLLTAGIFVFAFAIILAFTATKMQGETVLGLVAAYAAILVVFVGVS